jgi:hypothetical protein
MENQKKKWFQFRAFVSLLTALTFIMAILSGAALFVAPSGRGGRMWNFFGLDRRQWEDQHVWFCLVFSVIGLLHLILNLRPIVNYLKVVGSKVYRIRFEWLVALAVCVLIFTGTHYRWKPFARLYEVQRKIQQGWQQPSPAAASQEQGSRQEEQGQGFGQMTLREVCQQAGLDPEMAVQILKDKGITAEPDMTMRQIADRHGLHPSQLREKLIAP